MDKERFRKFSQRAKDALNFFDENEEVDTDNAIELADLLREALSELEKHCD